MAIDDDPIVGERVKADVAMRRLRRMRGKAVYLHVEMNVHVDDQEGVAEGMVRTWSVYHGIRATVAQAMDWLREVDRVERRRLEAGKCGVTVKYAESKRCVFISG